MSSARRSAALRQWAFVEDPAERTSKGRRTFLDRFEPLAGPSWRRARKTAYSRILLLLTKGRGVGVSDIPGLSRLYDRRGHVDVEVLSFRLECRAALSDACTAAGSYMVLRPLLAGSGRPLFHCRPRRTGVRADLSQSGRLLPT